MNNLGETIKKKAQELTSGISDRANGMVQEGMTNAMNKVSSIKNTGAPAMPVNPMAAERVAANRAKMQENKAAVMAKRQGLRDRIGSMRRNIMSSGGFMRRTRPSTTTDIME